MALNANPDPVRCANRWKHDRQPIPPAFAVILAGPRGDDVSARCDACIRELAGRPSDAIVVGVYELGPARTTARYDADTATG